jgi:hypothetical protein
MRNASLLALTLLLAITSMGASATDAWLLLRQPGGYSLVNATDREFREVFTAQHIALFANTERAIALLTCDDARQTHLVVVDKQTRKTRPVWTGSEFPGTQLMGPSEDMVVRGEDAFFISVRYAPDGRTIDRNGLGGVFDLVRVSMRSKQTETFPLPKKHANPRLSHYHDDLILTETFTNLAWVFDENTRTFTPIESGDLRRFGGPRAGIVPGETPSSDVAADSVFELPDHSFAYVDMRTNEVRLKLPDTPSQLLWDLNSKAPGSTPSLARVISMTR